MQITFDLTFNILPFAVPFANLKIDGILLLKIDEEYLVKMFPNEMKSVFKRRKMLRLITVLNEYMTKFEKVGVYQIDYEHHLIFVE